MEEEETADHFLKSCYALSAVRRRIFGTDVLGDVDIQLATAAELLRLVKASGRF